MKVAIVHDFLVYWGGGERVLAGLCKIFPDAPVYTLFYKNPFVKDFFPDTAIKSSFLQKIPLSRRLLLPLMPGAIESLNFEDYDVVISSGNFSKGIITSPHTRHIHYCHTPPRFLWEEENRYIRCNVPFGLRKVTSLAFHWLRIWDSAASERVDRYIANSQWTAKRIKKFYVRESAVIYPFISDKRKIASNKEKSAKDYFLIVSRLQRYKTIELAIKVFKKLKYPLLIAGGGPDEERLKRMADANIIFLGFVEEGELNALYRKAKAIILPGIEDFGLTIVEAANYGMPALAYRKGGALETVVEGKTGEFFKEQTEESFQEGLEKLIKNYPSYQKNEIMRNAQKFSFEHFKKEILDVINPNLQ